MINPDKYIMKSLVDTLSTATGYQFYDTSIPIDTKPIPTTYGIISNQTKRKRDVSKACYDWLCSVTIDLYVIGCVGVNDSASVDDVEEVVLNALDDSLHIDNFIVQEVGFVDSVNMSRSTETATLNRKVLVYEFWLDRS